MNPKPLDLEELAKLEHNQWVKWSKSIAESETISKKRLLRWKKLRVSYETLTEKEKERDRKWARKVLQRIKSACEFYLRYKDKPELFRKEQPQYLDDFCNGVISKIVLNTETKTKDIIPKYNEWLFKLAFGIKMKTMKPHIKGCCRQPNDCVCEIEKTNGNICWCHRE